MNRTEEVVEHLATAADHIDEALDIIDDMCQYMAKVKNDGEYNFYEEIWDKLDSACIMVNKLQQAIRAH